MGKSTGIFEKELPQERYPKKKRLLPLDIVCLEMTPESCACCSTCFLSHNKAITKDIAER